jgi:hypothetical protein
MGEGMGLGKPIHKLFTPLGWSRVAISFLRNNPSPKRYPWDDVKLSD